MPSHLNDDGTVALDPDDAQARALAIVNCGLCDDDGYRGGSVCDHVDHSAAARRGMDAIRAQMGWDGPKVAQNRAQPQESTSGGES